VTEVAGESARVRGYVVFREVSPGRWRLIGNVDHRPGLAMRAERAQAVRDATDGSGPDDGVYAALPRDQWHLMRHD